MTAAAGGPRTRFVSKAPKLGFVGSFDGIRGLGVCMVLVGHALFQYLESWVTIVDTFFVMSGFLIVTLLLQESRSTGTISIRKFYQRRAIRLLPSVFLFVSVWLVIGAVASLIGVKGLGLGEVAKDALAAVTYTYHVFFPNGLYMIHPGQQDKRTMWHLWTLSVEEHFYLIIPGLVWFCLKRNWVKLLGFAMGGGALAIGIARLLAYTGPAMSSGTPAGIRLAFLQRPDALMWGVTLAILNAHIDERTAERIRKPMMVVGYVGFAVWLAMLNLSSGFVDKLGLPYFKYLPDRPADATHAAMSGHWYWFRFGHTLGALAFAAMFFALYRYPGWWLERFFSLKPFRWMGRMSYTLYVWHALPYLIILVATGGDDASPAVKVLRTPILIAAAFAVSIPVFYKVEMRVMGMKMKFASEKETLDLRTGKMVDVGEALGDGKDAT
ncbi:MAG: acyltransferase [Acidimicrobiales bacterium]